MNYGGIFWNKVMINMEFERIVLVCKEKYGVISFIYIVGEF